MNWILENIYVNRIPLTLFLLTTNMFYYKHSSFIQFFYLFNFIYLNLSWKFNDHSYYILRILFNIHLHQKSMLKSTI